MLTFDPFGHAFSFENPINREASFPREKWKVTCRLPWSNGENISDQKDLASIGKLWWKSKQTELIIIF